MTVVVVAMYLAFGLNIFNQEFSTAGTMVYATFISLNVYFVIISPVQAGT